MEPPHASLALADMQFTAIRVVSFDATQGCARLAGPDALHYSSARWGAINGHHRETRSEQQARYRLLSPAIACSAPGPGRAWIHPSHAPSLHDTEEEPARPATLAIVSAQQQHFWSPWRPPHRRDVHECTGRPAGARAARRGLHCVAQGRIAPSSHSVTSDWPSGHSPLVIRPHKHMSMRLRHFTPVIPGPEGGPLDACGVGSPGIGSLCPRPIEFHLTVQLHFEESYHPYRTA